MAQGPTNDYKTLIIINLTNLTLKYTVKELHFMK